MGETKNIRSIKALCGGLWGGGAEGEIRRLLEALSPQGEGRHQDGAAVGVVGGALAVVDQRMAVVIGEPRWEAGSPSGISSSDPAQLVLEAYRQRGPDLLSMLRGSFAVILVDSRARRLIAAVDRMGTLPLYHVPTEEGIAVGSRADLPYQGAGSAPGLSAQGLYNYVYFHMVPSPGTIFEGVSKLPAAHYLLWEQGRLETVCYWLPEFTEDASASEAELGDEMLETISRCVTRAARGEGLGAFLSGGLDSSTVSGTLARILPGKARTYSIGFEAEGYDEMGFARIAADRYGTDQHEYYVTPGDVIEMVPRIAAYYDEPFGNASALPAFFCARMAREDGIRRLLAGDGGDEIFAGNERYQKQEVFELYHRLPALMRRGLLEPLVRVIPVAGGPIAKARSYIEQANTPLPDRLQSYNFLHRHAPQELFEQDFLASIETEQPLELLREVYRRPQEASALNRMLYLDWQFTLADNDLRKVTGMCDLAGVEVAYPLLDDDLIDMSCKVPSQWKMTPRELRRFYKRATSELLPRQILEKTKHGFGLPFGVWMHEHAPLREMAYDSLLALKRRHLLRPEFIDRAIEMHRSEHAAYYGVLIWILMMISLWLEAKR